MAEVQFKRKGARLCVAGELTIYQSAAFKAELLEFLGHCDAPELDLREVTEFDSAGFQVIALARREAVVQGKSLLLRDCSEPVRKVLEAYRVGDWVAAPAPRKSNRRSVSQEGAGHG